MKPLSIEFAAFGSYPGEVSVDFTALAARGLFVVTGDTGTGKSTIFDAMSYGLFGDMPLKPGNDIRSHHAEESQPTYARFTFHIDGATYVAERFPDQQRRALRGGGVTTERAKASFTRIDTNGTTSLATRVNDMKKAVADVVGLDAEQFRRVMLLPQGEVARFLLDDSANREGLLSTLFGGGVYDRIAEALRVEALRLKGQVGQADEALRHHLANARTHLSELGQQVDLTEPLPDDVERDGIDEHRAACDAALLALRSESDDATALAVACAKALTEGEQAAQRFHAAVEVRRVLDELNGLAPDVMANAERADASRLARPVVAAARLQAAQSAAVERALEAVAETRSRLVDLAQQHHVAVRVEPPEALADDVEALAAVVREHTALLEAVTSAGAELRRAEDDVKHHRGRQTAAHAQVQPLVDRLAAIDLRAGALLDAPNTLAAVDAEMQRLMTALEHVGQRDRAVTDLGALVEALTRAEGHHEAVLRRFVETTAPRLAAQLVSGEPCAVCGSVEHPAPATNDHGEPVDLEAVAQAQAAVVGARQHVNDAEVRVGQAQTRLGEWSNATAHDLASLVEASVARRQDAQAHCDERDALDAERVTVDETRQRAQSEIDRLKGVIEAGEAAVASARLAFGDATAGAAGVEPERVQVLRTASGELRSLAADLARQRSDAHAVQLAAEVATKSLKQNLVSSGFTDVAAAQAAVVDEHQEQRALERRDDLRNQLQQSQGRLAELKQLSIPEVPPDVEALAERAGAAEHVARELAARLTLAAKASFDLTVQLEHYDRVGAESEDLRRLARLTDRAQLVCRGQVGTKVSLSRWVLGRELDRVVAAASVHLGQMTSGRYTLRRMVEPSGGRSAQGLELEVLDAHTGRSRSPRTLSGGEQFQASLALALGLADVVSQGGNGSGRRIEALFVDEGFGSLDPRALDDAIETLHQLHASGRMVGAITHVEAMKERLHPGIVVTRLPDGKGSTLRVNP